MNLMNQGKPDELRFGRVIVKPAQRRVLVDGTPVALGARALDVLLTLIEHNERVVTKDELLRRAWPGLVVEENNLQVQISTLRKVLGQDAIATVPALGYRFTLAISDTERAMPALQGPARNIPPQLTRFIGHENDLADLDNLLARTRLLTLTGIGGCGKTRLALQLAERALPAFADGVGYVDLAPLQDAERVALTVAVALGFSEERDNAGDDLLCRRLAKQHMLLVLDNCEHLISASAALVVRLLAAASRLSLLIASREGLGVPGERLVAVRSLSFPDAKSKASLADVANYEAVQLFVDRARYLAPRFALSDETAPTVAEICRRLDGIPLAIELAAARIKMLSVEEIRARLDDRFLLLTGANRVALGRQQTLLATIQWSHDQLSEEERKVLRRLSVFAGGWTLEAAASVIGDGYDEYAMLAVLSRLADHSLIASQTAHGEATRYGMLETVRHYAQERLSESGEAPTTRDRHLAHFLALAQTAELGLGGPEQPAWQELLSREFENLLTAHAWCDQSENGAQSGLQLVAALRPYLGEHGLYVLGERLSSQALAREGAQVPNLARCRALAAAGVLVFFLGRYDESRAHADASLALATALQDASQEAMAHWIIGFTELAGGMHAEARASFERSLALSRSTQNSRQLTRTLIGLAELARTEGDLDQALQLNEEIFVLHSDRGDLGGMAVDLANLTMTTLDLGLATRARAYLVQAIELADRLGRDRQRIAPLFCAAGLAASKRDWSRAARFIGAMQGICEPMNYQIEPADKRFVATTVDATRVALGKEAFEAAVAGGRALSGERAMADVRAWLDEARIPSA